MCTAITFTTDDDIHFLARTMDFSFELDARPVYVPRNHEFNSLVPGTKFSTNYGFIGAGKDVDSYIFADGLNEKGFSIASLYFEKNAKYNKSSDPKLLNISSTDMVSWALGNISSVAEFEQKYQKLNVVDVINPLLQVNVPLHWIVSDKSGNTGVLEITKKGPQFYHNLVGTMTNSPEFSWHMNNLNHYTNLQPNEFEQKKYGDYVTVPDGPGSGALGLPGDYTSASRFVRAAFLREYSSHESGVKKGLTSILHILNSVDIPKGVKITQKNVSDYTQYKGIMDLNNLNYYLMRYNDTELTRVRLTDKLLNQSKVKVF
ncbi:choloylglycine hydrolase family protein [Liquorilactobacillus nagelii]|uniref:choloylglycine hydrolase family protein n=1 Tax=Liquorilactobacillus nagelii TaxID=82688 RepID=UPI0006EF1933|nr:choloylglycine hydrolase family protein [Liquorilactobacillus nagelii]KRL40951.1 choloylglycine hydrolase [Liquorilactobacillus nagelii DSM 13675]QYH53905.1 choloylglycine hydrolase family protein [Liquorilactobacillus nagelii DSM 13675]